MTFRPRLPLLAAFAPAPRRPPSRPRPRTANRSSSSTTPSRPRTSRRSAPSRSPRPRPAPARRTARRESPPTCWRPASRPRATRPPRSPSPPTAPGSPCSTATARTCSSTTPRPRPWSPRSRSPVRPRPRALLGRRPRGHGEHLGGHRLDPRPRRRDGGRGRARRRAAGRRPRHPPTGKTAVVGNTVDQSLSVIDIASATELQRIPGAGFVGVVSIAFEPGVITASFSGLEPRRRHDGDPPPTSGTTSSTSSTWPPAPSRRPPCDADPRAPLALTPDGSTAVVSHFLGVQRLSVVDTASQAVTKAIPTGTDLWLSVAIRPDGSQAVASVLNACLVVDLGHGRGLRAPRHRFRARAAHDRRRPASARRRLPRFP